MMRALLLPFAVATAVPAVSFAFSTPAFAQDAAAAEDAVQDDDAPAPGAEPRSAGAVACLYNGVRRDGNDTLFTVVIRNGFNSTNAEESRVLRRIRTQITDCRSRYGWGDARQQVAIQYMTGRVLKAEAMSVLHGFGVTREMIDAVVETLTPEQGQAFVNGSVDATLSRAALATLTAHGFSVASLTEEQRLGFGAKFGQAIAGEVIARDAEERYRH